MPSPRLTNCLLACLFVPAILWGEQLAVSLQPERSKVLAGSKVRVAAVLSLKAPPAPAGTPDTSVSLTLVLDKSGSMSDAGKMEMVHVAGGELVDYLQSTDRLGVVGFDGRTDVIRPLLYVNDKDGIKKLIRQLSPGSSTNLGGGLSVGLGLYR